MKVTRRDILKGASSLFLAPAALLAIQQGVGAQSTGTILDTSPSDYIDYRAAFLRALTPSEGDLQGLLRQEFRQLQPAGAIYASYLDQFSAKPLPDVLQLDLAVIPVNGPNEGRVNSLKRSFVSADTFWGVQVEVYACDSIQTAQKYIKHAIHTTQAAWRKGTLLNRAAIGDESWVVDATPLYTNALWLRFGAIVARVDASASGNPEAYGLSLQIPPSVAEAVAHMILLKAARGSNLSQKTLHINPLEPAGPDLSVLIRVNGELLPRHSCQQVGEQIYAPVLPFADAAHQNLQARWEPSVGALMLLGPPYPVLTLATGSIIVKEGPPTKTMLKVPLFKDGNQPYMALSDLLSLLPRSKMQAEGEGFSIQASAI